MAFRFAQKLQDYLNEAIVKGVRDDALTPLPDVKDWTSLGEWSATTWVSIVRFEHPLMKGTLVIAADEDCVLSLQPELAVATGDERTECLKDWLGEASNLAMGRLKYSMLSHDVSLKFTPASVELVPPSILEEYASRQPTQRFWFGHDGHHLCVQLGADISEDVDFYTIPDPSRNLAKPGDMILSLSQYRATEADRGREANSGLTERATEARRPTLETLSLEGTKGILLRFSGGIEVRLDLATLVELGQNKFTVCDQTITVAQDAEGYSFAIEGLSLYLPTRQAA